MTAPTQLISPTETAKRVSLSWRSVQRLVRAGQFPSPVRLSTQRIAFHESEVSEWIATRPRAGIEQSGDDAAQSHPTLRRKPDDK